MVLLRTAILGSTLALALVSCTPSPETLFAEGQTAFEAFDYRTARIQLTNGLAQQPDNLEMQLLLVRTLLKLGDGESANTRLQDLPQHARSLAMTKLLQAEADVLSGRYDAAIANVEAIETAEADRVRALAFVGKGDAEQAVAAFSDGMERSPRSPRLIADYARFSLERGEWARADELSRIALELDQDQIAAMLVRADLEERRNRMQQSLRAHEKVLKIDRGNFAARLGTARILAKTGRSKAALEMAEALAAEDPGSLGIARIRAQISADAGEWGAVRSQLQPFEAEVTQEPEAAILYSEALVELGLPAQAVGYLAPMFESRPGWRELRTLYARAQAESGQPAAAFATIRPLASQPDASPGELRLATRIARLAGDKETADFARRTATPAPEWVGRAISQGDIALRNGQWAAAEEVYLDIVAAFGASNALVLNNLAYAQGRLGKSNEALKSALVAVKLEPENPSILDTAGSLLIANGQRTRGLAMLEKAARLAPGNEAIARNLSKAQSR